MNNNLINGVKKLKERIKAFILTRELTEKECWVNFREINNIIGSQEISVKIFKRGKMKHHFPIYKMESNIIGIDRDNNKFREKQKINEISTIESEDIGGYDFIFKLDRKGFEDYFYHKEIYLELRINEWFVKEIDLTPYFFKFRSLIERSQEINDYFDKNKIGMSSPELTLADISKKWEKQEKKEKLGIRNNI